MMNQHPHRSSPLSNVPFIPCLSFLSSRQFKASSTVRKGSKNLAKVQSTIRCDFSTRPKALSQFVPLTDLFLVFYLKSTIYTTHPIPLSTDSSWCQAIPINQKNDTSHRNGTLGDKGCIGDPSHLYSDHSVILCPWFCGKLYSGSPLLAPS